MRLRLAAACGDEQPAGARPLRCGMGFGARTISATAPRMIPPPTIVRHPSGSPRTSVPSRTATTGFTYA